MVHTHMTQALSSVGNAVTRTNPSRIWRNTRYALKSAENYFITTDAYTFNITLTRKVNDCLWTQNYIFVFVLHLQKHIQIFERAVEDAKDGRVDKAYPVLQKTLTFMEDFLVIPNKDYVTCLSTLKQCYRAMGNSSNKILQQQQ